MSLLGIELGKNKLSIGVFSTGGIILHKESLLLEGREGKQVGALITYVIGVVLKADRFASDPVNAIGICIDGIVLREKGTVSIPEIPGWDNYGLMNEVISICGIIPITIDSNRSCYIMGESWKGIARECKDAIFLAVGSGINAGIISDGKLLRGSHDVSGAIGWMALNKPFINEFKRYGNFDYFASAKGMERLARNILQEVSSYQGQLRNKNIEDITMHDVFVAFEHDDEIALNVLSVCVGYWGMAIANLVSLFNPAKVILGGSVFGPALSLIDEIKSEAAKWANPLSMQQVKIVASELGDDAGIYGAAYIALKATNGKALFNNG